MILRYALVATATLFTVACMPQQPTEPAGEPMEQQSRAERLSDGEIVHAIIANNGFELRSARLALMKSDTPAIEQYAERLIQDHSQSTDRLREFATRADLNLDESQLSRDLVAKSEMVLDRLDDMEGRDFDRAFLLAQMDAHSDTLDLVETRLLPQADDDELRLRLERMTPVLRDHHERARALYENMRVRG